MFETAFFFNFKKLFKMKKFSSFIISIFVLLFFSCNDFQTKSHRVVIIALDGISVEGFQKANTPNLDKLALEGVLSLNTRDVMPSVTLPNWTSHLTGSGPEQHGVVDNGWKLDQFILPPVEKDAKGYYPSIFKVVKDQVPNVKTAFYYNWNRLIYPYNQEYIDDVNYEESDGYKTNYEKALNFIIENKDHPELVFLYTVHTDHAGHHEGWMSPAYISSIEEADVEIGAFLAKLKKQDLYDDTHFMFFTDHGGIGKGHGGFTTTEMEVPWVITGPGIKKGSILTEPNNTVNTSTTISYLFNCTSPLSWTGEIPMSIFSE